MRHENTSFCLNFSSLLVIAFSTSLRLFRLSSSWWSVIWRSLIQLEPWIDLTSSLFMRWTDYSCSWTNVGIHCEFDTGVEHSNWRLTYLHRSSIFFFVFNSIWFRYKDCYCSSIEKRHKKIVKKKRSSFCWITRFWVILLGESLETYWF